MPGLAKLYLSYRALWIACVGMPRFIALILILRAVDPCAGVQIVRRNWYVQTRGGATSVMEVASDGSPWLESTQRSLYSVVSAVALIVFEYLTTLDREVDFVRGRKLSWAKCIFLLNRYGSILNCLAITVMSLPTTDPLVSAEIASPLS
ncbi:hypothetical protein LXA43DRAFT_108182 [Ganoderma leucocontextum]|nr:hypothetical protein LXA43DRAFT_108182 [Ganoderma leucocontextum]